MGHLAATYTYTSSSSSGAGLAVLLIVVVALYFITALGTYGTYKKAGSYGEPAWSAFVPIYNWIILLRIAGRPKTWAWFLLMVIVPYVGSLAFLVVAIIVLNDISKSFGHGGGFTVGLVLLSVIFWYILWLGSSTYRGPAGPTGAGGTFGGARMPEPGYPPQQPGYPPVQPGYPPAGQAPPPPTVGQAPPPPPPAPPSPGQAPPPPGQMPPPQ